MFGLYCAAIIIIRCICLLEGVSENKKAEYTPNHNVVLLGIYI